MPLKQFLANPLFAPNQDGDRISLQPRRHDDYREDYRSGMLQITFSPSVVRPSSTKHAGAPRPVPTSPVEDYRKLVPAIEVHIEILENALLEHSIGEMEQDEAARAHVTQLKTWLHSLQTQRTNILTLISTHETLQKRVAIVTSHQSRTKHPIQASYDEYHAYLQSRRQIVELLAERDGVYALLAEVAREVVELEQELAMEFYRLERAMPECERAGEPPPAYEERVVRR